MLNIIIKDVVIKIVFELFIEMVAKKLVIIDNSPTENPLLNNALDIIANHHKQKKEGFFGDYTMACVRTCKRSRKRAWFY